MPYADQTHILNKAILDKQLAKKAWYNTFWSKLAGFMTITETNGIKQHNPAPGKVLQVMKDFIAEGRDNMLMPMMLPLEQPGVYGDSTLKGTGELLRLKYLQLYINQHRKAAVPMPGKMSNQRLKMYNLTQKAMPELVTWWAKTENQAIWEAMYCGVSPNISAGTNDDGLGLKVRFHPNWYYEDTATTGGLLTPVGTEFYTKTVSDITTALTSSSHVEQITHLTLLALSELIVSQLLIEPIVHDGSDPFWLLVVHPAVFTTLKKNTSIKTDQNAAYNAKLMTHPAINGKKMLYYEGFCIIEDGIGIRSLPTASTDPIADLASTYGWLRPSLKTNAIHNCILLGANAIGKGLASSLQYTEEIDDHGNLKEIGSNQIYGYNRAEFFEEADVASVYSLNNATKSALSTGYEAVNQSSMILSVQA